MTASTVNPPISVIVNTVDRAECIGNLLNYLERQSYPEFEVIIVVGPTRDNTLEVLAQYEGRIRIVRCPDANLSQSRNLGLLAARGDIVVYIDDDAVPSYHLLSQYARIFANPTVDVTGGLVWAAYPQFSMLQFRLGIYSSIGEQEDIRSSWIDKIHPPGMSSRWILRCMGANLASRRQALLDVGGFDEFFGYSAEETDLALRLVSQGKNVYPVNQAVVYHFPASSRNRIVFTNKGRWWLRTRSRIYLGIKNGLPSGEPLGIVIKRSVRSAGANFLLYLNLLRARNITLLDFLRMFINESIVLPSATLQGLFRKRQLIPPSVIEEAQKINEPILKFQNPDSSQKPTVDPITGYSPVISMPAPPLRVCLLSNSYPPPTTGGVARLTNLMAQGLFELGHTVHVITQGEKEQVAFYDGAFVHKIPNRLHRYESYRHLLNLYSILNYSHNVYDKARQLMLNDGIQIVDSPLWLSEGLVTLMSNMVPVVARLITGVRQLTEIHNQQTGEFALLGDLEQALLQKAHHLLPNTQATFNAIRAIYDLQSIDQRYTIVPYGIVPAPQEQVRPFETDTVKDTLTVLFVGRLEKRKGILDLLEAIPLVLGQFPNVRFVIAGLDNSEFDGFRYRTGLDYPTYFAQHHPEHLPYVKFMGMVSEDVLQNLYQSCDLFVAPSLYESFGLIYLEAMNYAKPVIGCRAGGIPEVVDHQLTGLLVEPAAPKGLAEAMVSLLKSPVQLREMGLAGRSQIVERFNYLTMARNYERVYRRVIHDFNNQVPSVSTPE